MNVPFLYIFTCMLAILGSPWENLLYEKIMHVLKVYFEKRREKCYISISLRGILFSLAFHLHGFFFFGRTEYYTFSEREREYGGQEAYFAAQKGKFKMESLKLSLALRTVLCELLILI